MDVNCMQPKLESAVIAILGQISEPLPLLILRYREIQQFFFA